MSTPTPPSDGATYKQAEKLLAKVGAAHATGDALRACMAGLLPHLHGGKAEKYFEFLKTVPDDQLTNVTTGMARNRDAAWDALIGIPLPRFDQFGAIIQ